MAAGVLTSASEAFLGDSQVARLIASRDWSDSPIGPPAQWPQVLKTTVSIMLGSPVPIVLLWGEDGIMIYNDAYSEFAGGRHPELLGSRVREGWPEVADFNDNVMKVGLGGGTLSYEDQELTLYRHGRPEQVWMNLDYSPVMDESGRPAGVIAIVVETTAAVLAERALRDSEQQLRLVIDGARDHAIFTTDADRVITAWSEGAAQIFGYSEAEALGMCADLLWTEEDRASGQPQREVENADRDGCGNDERWHLRSDGTRVFLNGSVHPLPPTPGGGPRGYLKIARDETGKRSAEQSLRASETRYRGVFENAGLGIVEISDDWKVLGVNPAYASVVGRSVEEMTGQTYLDFTHPDDIELSKQMLRSVAAGANETVSFEKRYITSDGDIVWVRNTLSRLQSTTGAPSYLKLVEDITPVREAQQALEKLNEQLESRVGEEVERRAAAEEILRQSQKMETVGQLSGGIAHDFNNLLQIIQGNLSLLQQSLGDEEGRRQRWVTNALQGTERAAALTQRLLAFSRRQPLAPQTIDANRMIADMADLLHRTLGESIDLRTSFDPELWLTDADANQLENAILNLAINARDAMDGRGRMCIETRNCTVDAAYAARNPDSEAGEYVLIEVSDEGPGMEPHVLERAIEPFFTTKDVGKGTGLGLSMVYGFAQQSGGHFRIYSEPGHGTTAKIYLPRNHEGAADLGRERGPAQELPRGNGETILLCEDDEDVRHFSVEALRGLGYNVVHAQNARGALAKLSELGRVDVLFTDVVLPGEMTGPELASAARQVQPGLEVLYTTGYARSSLDHQGKLGTDFAVIMKPFSVTELAAKIRQVIDSAKPC